MIARRNDVADLGTCPEYEKLETSRPAVGALMPWEYLESRPSSRSRSRRLRGDPARENMAGGHPRNRPRTSCAAFRARPRTEKQPQQNNPFTEGSLQEPPVQLAAMHNPAQAVGVRLPGPA